MSDQYAPDYHLQLDGKPIPAGLRGAITSITHTSALEGSDRVEVAVVNQYLRWTDDPLLAPGVTLKLSLGYNPDAFEQVFVGQIVSVQASFPADGLPTLTIAAQDRFERLRESVKSRWFAIPFPFFKNGPIPDPIIAAMVSAENGLIPIIDPVGAALSVILYGATVIAAAADGDVQTLVRHQDQESDLDFLKRVSKENGWEMFIDHSGPLGGRKLRFMSPLDELEPTRTYAYGASLVDWAPRVTTVGVIASVTAFLRVPAIKTVFEVTVGYDWDRASLDVTIRPAMLGELPTPPSDEENADGADERTLMIKENLSLVSAPRRILSQLIPSLNGRLTGSGSVVGDPALIAGRVVQLEGLGKEFGGRYRITTATHTIDSGGYRTRFEGRREIWFGSIPALDQGAIALRAPFVELAAAGAR